MKTTRQIGAIIIAATLLGACTTQAQQTAQTSDTRMAARCDYGTPHPDAPPEFAQFDFLIGDFDITSHIMTPQGWSPPRPSPHARWNGWYSLSGMTITDEWYDPDPASDPNALRGVNVRLYDSEAAEWKMMWIATGGKQVQDLRAGMRGGKLTMWQVYPKPIDLVADFTVEDTDHWYRVSYVTDEAGKRVPKYKLRATRIPCE